ncbi:hypothetical protein H6F50_20660 [Coleofasciculus sp. FACHB-712]|nr:MULTISPECIES: hypothetical protein [unclassified Coleofasciculus]MBD1838920.1 hypothetical protein [Coleofasciculus sp. FACHB-501]MBD1944740.1 hypothetical protein [Coleofasciculus sp. FACHB-712]
MPNIQDKLLSFFYSVQFFLFTLSPQPSVLSPQPSALSPQSLLLSLQK